MGPKAAAAKVTVTAAPKTATPTKKNKAKKAKALKKNKANKTKKAPPISKKAQKALAKERLATDKKTQLNSMVGQLKKATLAKGDIVYEQTGEGKERSSTLVIAGLPTFK